MQANANILMNLLGTLIGAGAAFEEEAVEHMKKAKTLLVTEVRR